MNYSRIDHSDHLIHFTKNSLNWSYEESYQTFCKIILEKLINPSTTLRLGNISSICFTEASYAALTDNGELNKKYFKRYSPFGFMFSKKYIYSMGGLPVIYSPRFHYEHDKENDYTNWRTVIYDPVGNTGEFRDFTWEREWRIKAVDGALGIDPEHIKLVFPSKQWAERFRDDHDAEHQLEYCDCICTRKCQIINYDRYLSEEENQILEGTCEEPTQFPWILLNMNCINIPPPK